MWLSRNITQAPLKKIPIHVLIPCWHYGGTDKRFYSQDIWEAACEKRTDDVKSDAMDACALSKSYAKGQIGVDMDTLLDKAARGTPPELEVGELGFVGAFLDIGDVSLSARSEDGRVSNVEIGPHRGEFRFDEYSGEVEQYVAVVTSDTITKPPDTQSILLGLATRDGISRRVGIGWVYYSKEAGDPLPPWKYRFFRIA